MTCSQARAGLSRAGECLSDSSGKDCGSFLGWDGAVGDGDTGRPLRRQFSRLLARAA